MADKLYKMQKRLVMWPNKGPVLGGDTGADHANGDDMFHLADHICSANGDKTRLEDWSTCKSIAF